VCDLCYVRYPLMALQADAVYLDHRTAFEARKELNEDPEIVERAFTTIPDVRAIKRTLERLEKKVDALKPKGADDDDDNNKKEKRVRTE
jgi:hypothetical protein